MNVWNKYIVLPSFLKSHFSTLIDCDGFQEEEDELDHELLCNDVNLDGDEEYVEYYDDVGGGKARSKQAGKRSDKPKGKIQGK